jgi:ribosome biogenesis GTPase / thiamine phosphate phosphatase
MNQQSIHPLNLAGYGWSDFFETTDPALQYTIPVRVMAVHRDAYDVAAPEFSGRIKGNATAGSEEARPTVGDWVAIDPASKRIVVLYPRKSLFKRRNAGKTNRLQLIAANVDTVFIVTSANMDFNIARLERYLALAHEAAVLPVLIITKADLVADITPFFEQARTLQSDLCIEVLDARAKNILAILQQWLGNGKTVALMGSSGVGKSTIINSLLGHQAQETGALPALAGHQAFKDNATRQKVGAIREGDSRGRHTTSGRSLHRIQTGAWLIDTPGMREIQVVDSEEGVEMVFDDIAALGINCRFSNCSHKTEPGCAIQSAIASGILDKNRLERFQKLQIEERQNTKSMYEANERSRAFGKFSKNAQKQKAKRGED